MNSSKNPIKAVEPSPENHLQNLNIQQGSTYLYAHRLETLQQMDIFYIQYRICMHVHIYYRI